MVIELLDMHFIKFELCNQMEIGPMPGQMVAIDTNEIQIDFSKEPQHMLNI